MQYKNFFNNAKAKKITNIQIAETSTNYINIDVKNGKLSDYDVLFQKKYNVKAEYKGKTVKLNTEYLDDSILELVKIKAEYTDTKYEDEYLNDTSNNNNNKLEKITDKDEVLKRLYQADSFRKKNSYIKELNIYFEDENKVVRIINSNNVDISTVSHIYELCIEFVLEKDIIVNNYEKYIVTSYEELKIEEYIEKVYKETLKMLEKEKIESKKYDLILSQSVSGEILSHIISMISAGNIRQKISCMDGKLNKKIFSEKITIVEDPTNNRLPGYSKFDYEGTKTYKKNIVENGVLKTYLYDNKEAKQKNVKSTGNSYDGINTRNMYILPGELSKEVLFKHLNNGLYITDYMGAMNSSIDTNSGNISLQVFGLIIEDGKIKKGFESSIMTTNIFELLSNVEHISKDLNFSIISAASPELLIKNISIVAN